MASQEYPKTAANTVKRYGNDRASYDYKTIHTIINTCPVLHVSFADPTNPFPAVLPMIGCTGDFTNPSADPNTLPQNIYIHGYVSSRLMKTGSSPDSEEGLPITIAATHLDGLVLALTPNHCSCNFRSAIAFGYATLVTDEAEKTWAMEKITNNMLPTRWENSRIPPTQTEMTSTSILRVKISSASAKVRAGGPGEDRADLKDEALKKRVWTGVVPVWMQWGEPMPGPENKVDEVPGYIEGWRMRANQEGRVEAFKAIESE
ncbi:hypothetical protein K469DRAFT_711058 [Zopfia rhizophila CBS 207.26]|uniref:5-nitroimidazole antibiotic resistance protein n=1 Tax=Zopfia rhizophila CBS 207.26 TaxID=1314779 RepID=A0A6A6DY14_9PEZI|nr:hypothetical protein K469DRAFT_711058 [Zopfia rhizophila CBS 207.26]